MNLHISIRGLSGLWHFALGWRMDSGMVDIVVHLVGSRRVKLESFREAVAQAGIEDLLISWGFPQMEVPQKSWLIS